MGGGQLGRMLALAGAPLGLSFRFLEPRSPAPVDGLGEVVRAEYDDTAALDRFADGLDVVTYEFENVPAASTERLRGRVPLHPSPSLLAVAQDRLEEKSAFAAAGIPAAEHRPVDGPEAFAAAVAALGLPLVVKRRRFGYDGKGQVVLRDANEVATALDGLGAGPFIAERFVSFRRELSLVGVRAIDGTFHAYPLVENEHGDGILLRTVAPAPDVPEALQAAAESCVRDIAAVHDAVGVLAVEFFETEEGLLANELAPRVHNSGHWTQDGAETCQFENHLRAVCGLPLGPTAVRAPTVMRNLIGTLPPLEAILRIAGAHLHLYDKAPRPGRKLGHVNVTGVPGAREIALRELDALLEASRDPSGRR